MNLRIMIVEDEAGVRATLRNLILQNHPSAEIVAEAASVAEAQNWIKRIHADILFLDVQLLDGTGFDLLDRIPKMNIRVIFTTAFDEFAVKAFRYNAIDYLLKPIHPDELAVAIEKAQQKLNLYDQEKLFSNLVRTNAEQIFDRITLPTSEGPVFAKTKEICRLESCGNYSFVYLVNGERHLAARNLKEFEEMLPHPYFFRLHQSHIVNTGFVKKILKEDGGLAIMQDGTKIQVARRRKETFIDVLQQTVKIHI
ncbi:MAG: LytTR family DNA-binding domain-containing protein [Saprospiraceae bacterium]|nr:LytTR family DNA-binding domain-containing protein [Saprospiraceae bacterium]